MLAKFIKQTIFIYQRKNKKHLKWFLLKTRKQIRLKMPLKIRKKHRAQNLPKLALR